MFWYCLGMQICISENMSVATNSNGYGTKYMVFSRYIFSKPLSESMLTYCQLDPEEHTCSSMKSVWSSIYWIWLTLNTLRLSQNGRHFLDNIFKCTFLNENVWIFIKIPPKFVPQGPINDIPALVQIMAWWWPGDKPLSEPMMVRLPMHIWVTQPQWVKHWETHGCVVSIVAIDGLVL